MASPPIIVNTPDNEVLNFKQREGENLKDAWYRICNALKLDPLESNLLPFFFAIFMLASPLGIDRFLIPLPEGISWVAILLILIML